MKKRNLYIRTSLLMIILTVISKLIGFFREVLIANYYGSSFVVDAYNLAQGIPGILFGGILGSIAVGFTPVYSQVAVHDDNLEKSNRFTSRLINIGTVFAIIIFIICFFISDFLVRVFASGFKGETFELASYYVKVVSAFSIFTFASGIFGSFLHYHGKYLAPIVNGYLQNIGTIVLVIISAYTSHYYLIYGLLLGYFLKFLADYLCVRKVGFRHTVDFTFDEHIKEIVRIAIPVFIGSYINDINAIVDKFIASRLPEGSIANLHYGNLVVTLILTLTSSIVNTIMYPQISKSYANGETENFNKLIKQSFSIVLLITIPFMLATQFFNNQVIQVIYERGAFSMTSTDNCAKAFALYGLGLVFNAMNGLLISIFYSMKDSKTPLFSSTIGIIMNVVLNIILSRKMGFSGLALATSISACVSALIKCWQLNSKYNIRVLPKFNQMAKIIIASIIAVVCAWLIYPYTSVISQLRTIMLALSAIFAMLIYVVLMVVFKIDEAQFVKDLFHRK